MLIFFLHILASCSLASNGQTFYVSSSSGNDANSGLSESDPLLTLSKAFSKGSCNSILLKAGDLFFYESTKLVGGTMGRYGVGNNPVLCGYKRIANPNWENVSKNIWRISLTQDNYWGVQVNGSSYSNNIGCIHEYDKDLVHGRKRHYLNQLCRDWDIWQTDKTGVDSKPEYYDSLYLYYSGDPNELKLEFATGQIAVNMRDASFENINVVGYGFGISAGSNVHIKGCHIDAIGGRTLVTSNSFVCDGNGIGIWIYPDRDTENTLVEDCYISRVYDCGVCLQGSEGSHATARNIKVRNNLITNCCQGWEDALFNDPPACYENCVFENNTIVFSGESGFGYPDSRFKYCHVLSNNLNGDKKMIFRDNTFIGGNFQCGGGYKGKYTTNIMEGNVCYLTNDNYLIGNYFGTRDVIRQANSQESLTRYKNLTNDKTTKFVVCDSLRIKKMGENVINKYLRQNHY